MVQTATVTLGRSEAREKPLSEQRLGLRQRLVIVHQQLRPALRVGCQEAAKVNSCPDRPVLVTADRVGSS
jgi:hypothetical protein